MTLREWRENQWLNDHETSPQEITDLLAVVDRDLADARIERVSADWRLGIAYNASLQLANLALAATGYRAARTRQHERTIQSLRFTVGADRPIVDALDAIRRKRNTSNYDRAGTASMAEVDEALRIATHLREKVLQWLGANFPELLGESD